MREILFRGKREDNGKWIDGSLLFDPDLGSAQIIGFEYWTSETGTERGQFSEFVNRETVGQYTGLKDKYGKRIFEGDIVESVFTSRPYLVCFGKYTYTDEYGEEECASGWYNEEEGGYKTAMVCTDVWATVIGNIHDNPELMEGR